MKRQKLVKLGILFLLGVFVLGAAVPAIAENSTGQDITTGFKNAGKALKGAFGMGKGAGGVDVIQAVADLTGLEVSAIREARQEGKSLAAIAQEAGVTEDTLISKIAELEKSKLQTALDDGKITQDQYDKLTADLKTRIKVMVENTKEPNGPRGEGMGPGFGPGGCLQAVADLTGQDLKTIMDARQEGKSLAAIAEAAGVSEDTLISKIAADEKARLQTALDDGKITQEKHDELAANIESRVKEIVENTDVMPAPEMRGMGPGFGPGGCLQAVADLTGQDLKTIMDARQEGKSLAAIAEAAGVSEDTLISKIAADEKARLQTALDDGKITQEKYDEMVADIETRIKTMVESTDTFGSGKGGHGPGGCGPKNNGAAKSKSAL